MITFQRESHIPYGPPTTVTWLQLLRKHTNAGTSTALTAQTHWSTRTQLRALSRHRPRLANVTCSWIWRLFEISPAIYWVSTVLWGYRCVCVCVCVCVSETQQGHFFPLGPLKRCNSRDGQTVTSDVPVWTQTRLVTELSIRLKKKPLEFSSNAAHISC